MLIKPGIVSEKLIQTWSTRERIRKSLKSTENPEHVWKRIKEVFVNFKHFAGRNPAGVWKTQSFQ